MLKKWVIRAPKAPPVLSVSLSVCIFVCLLSFGTKGTLQAPTSSPVCLSFSSALAQKGLCTPPPNPLIKGICFTGLETGCKPILFLFVRRLLGLFCIVPLYFLKYSLLLSLSYRLRGFCYLYA